MTSKGGLASVGDTMSDPNSDSEDRLQHLRRILVGPTESQLDALRERIDTEVSAEKVSQLLPNAIRKSANHGDDLARALGPTLNQSFQQSIKRDPQALADSIAPIMGPAIRQSIVQTIRQMTQSLNTALEHSFSPQGLKWRFEAWRTGKSFGEVLLLHTLIYRTDQLLLIDKKSGLLMHSVSAIDDDDADLVSGMLTAIQDFVADSFRQEKDAALQTMTSGDLTIWIQRGPIAYLAAAIRGEPPETLHDTLQQALESIHIDHRELLEDFDGNTDPLEVVRPYLEDCLETEFARNGQQAEELTETKTTSKLVWVFPTLFLLGCILWATMFWRHRSRLREISIVLDVPPTVKLVLEGGTLKLQGSANHDWIQSAKNRFHRLDDRVVKGLDTDEVQVADANWVEFLRLLRIEPGIVVTEAARNGDRYEVSGLRDPLSLDPKKLMQLAGLEEPVDQFWKPYRCLDIGVSLSRLQQQLRSMSTVQFIADKDADRLIAKGRAPKAWIQELENAVSLLGIADRVEIRVLSDD